MILKDQKMFAEGITVSLPSSRLFDALVRNHLRNPGGPATAPTQMLIQSKPYFSSWYIGSGNDVAPSASPDSRMVLGFLIYSMLSLPEKAEVPTDVLKKRNQEMTLRSMFDWPQNLSHCSLPLP